VVVDAVVIGLIFTTYKNIGLVPVGLQKVFEPIIDYFYDLTRQISGSKATTIFPWFASFFFFILFANLIGLLPGFGSIGFWEETHVVAESATSHENQAGEVVKESTTAHGVSDSHSKTETAASTHTKEASGEQTKHLVPVLRAATSDFNLTLALGTISIVATHIISIRYNGLFGYLRKFLSKNPIHLAIGLLEFVLEAVKIFSLSFRLFGNIFAGEIVLITVAGLFAFFAPIPFLMLETIVALVQALVFAMLTMVFMSLLATTSSEGGGH
jgi:F-type H+-transporting ATPase subunit a